MASVTNLIAKVAPPSDGAKASKGKADSDTAFAAMVAGAATPDTQPALAPKSVRGGDKTQHGKRDNDPTQSDDNDQPAIADGPPPILVALPAGGPVATAAKTAKSSKPSADGAPRTTSAPVPASTPTGGAVADIDLTQAAVDTTDPVLAPVLAALADSLAAKQASDQPVAPVPANPAPTLETAIAATAPPTAATAALMTARINTGGAPFSGSADAKASATGSRKSADDADPDSSVAAPDATTVVAMPPWVGASTGLAATPYAPVTDGAAGQLATGAADRQLDLAKQGAWLDGLSHDIAATTAGAGPLRFAVAPQHLGAVQVEMTRDAVGATVTLTASSEAGRAALADARPQLIAEARNNGIHIASAQVDVGTGQTGTDSRQASSGQSDSRPSMSGGGSFSANANAQGESGRQSQTRSQPSAANPVSTTGSPDADAAPEPADGLYA